MSIGKSRLGRQSPYQLRLERAAPAEELDHRQVDAHARGRARRPARRCRPGRGRRTPARSTFGLPTASMHTSAPLPSVSSRMASTGSVDEASTVWVAPNSRAASSFRGSRSTAMTMAAPGEPGRRQGHRRRPRPAQARAAHEFGATHTVDASSTDPVEAIQALTDGNGADVCIEAVGHPDGPRAGVLRPRPGRHPRPGRRARPDMTHRAADDRVLRPGWRAQAVAGTATACRAATSRCSSTSTCRAGSTSTASSARRSPSTRSRRRSTHGARRGAALGGRS